METMIDVLTIITILLFIILFYLIHTLKRNDRLAKFLLWVVELDSRIEAKNILTGKYDNYFLFNKLPSYTKMLYSFKSLKLESWFDEDDVKILKSVI